MAGSYDEEFLALVRLHLEPVLRGGGFAFSQVALGSAPGGAALVSGPGPNRLSRLLRRGDRIPPATTTTILFEADAQQFAEQFPGSAEHPTDPDCKDLWLFAHAVERFLARARAAPQ